MAASVSEWCLKRVSVAVEIGLYLWCSEAGDLRDPLDGFSKWKMDGKDDAWFGFDLWLFCFLMHDQFWVFMQRWLMRLCACVIIIIIHTSPLGAWWSQESWTILKDSFYYYDLFLWDIKRNWTWNIFFSLHSNNSIIVFLFIWVF